MLQYVIGADKIVIAGDIDDDSYRELDDMLKCVDPSVVFVDTTLGLRTFFLSRQYVALGLRNFR